MKELQRWCPGCAALRGRREWPLHSKARMAGAPIHVLAVDDDDASRAMLAASLEALGYQAEVAGSGAAALARLSRPPLPDVVLLDVVMRDLGGIETLRRYRAQGGAVPIVMMSGLAETEAALQARRLGAVDYVTKPIHHTELREVIERVVELRPMRASTSTSMVPGTRRARTTLGVSPAMRKVDALIDRVSDADVPVLITGESGVGKDVVAREIHARSARHDRVFVKINCAALPENLLESELFGYERGAFTGAQRAKPGQFELADAGTLFLDEIGEMPAPLQAKLLQVLQDGEFYRVGGQKRVRVDVRTIVATNRDLERAIGDGSFREDLYYRLNVVHVHVPPLRERRHDIPSLLALFADKYGRRYARGNTEIPREVVARFLAYDWPGNVRELENLVRSLIVLRDPSYVYAEMRPAGRIPRPIDDCDPAPEVSSLGSVGTDSPQQTDPDEAREDNRPIIPPLLSSPLDYHGDAALDAFVPAIHLPAPTLPTRPAPLDDYESGMPTTPTVRSPSELPHGSVMPAALPRPLGSYPFGGYASDAAARPLGEVVAAEFSAAGESGMVDLKALGRKATDIVEREAIVAMLARTGGSKREAAERLRISYKAILYKIREFGIGRPRVRRAAASGVGEIAPAEAAGSPIAED